MKREKFCYDCDTDFVVKSLNKDPVSFCPFCGSEVSEDENIDDEIFNEDD